MDSDVPSPPVRRYIMADLIQLRYSPLVNPPLLDLPGEMKVRKRGKKGGVKARNKRRSARPILPKIMMGNVQSLGNKVDELHASVIHDEAFRMCSFMCFSETWLNEKITDSVVQIDGFKLIRGDRN